MRVLAKILFHLCLLIIPATSFGGIYAQSGYEEGKDGVLLLTEKCPGYAGDAGFKLAVIRVNGNVMQGCYVKNNRGNFVAKWQDGTVNEMPSNVFKLKKIDSRNYENEINWDEARPLYIYIDGEKSCFKSEYGMLSSPWGNLEVPEEDRIVSNDRRSMILIGRYKDGRLSRIYHYLTIEECNGQVAKK